MGLEEITDKHAQVERANRRGATHAHVQHSWSWLLRKEGHSPADIYQRLSEGLISEQVYNFGIGREIMDIIYATLLSHIRSPAI